MVDWVDWDDELVAFSCWLRVRHVCRQLRQPYSEAFRDFAARFGL